MHKLIELVEIIDKLLRYKFVQLIMKTTLDLFFLQEVIAVKFKSNFCYLIKLFRSHFRMIQELTLLSTSARYIFSQLLNFFKLLAKILRVKKSNRLVTQNAFEVILKRGIRIVDFAKMKCPQLFYISYYYKIIKDNTKINDFLSFSLFHRKMIV